jgi:hypothetical protein
MVISFFMALPFCIGQWNDQTVSVLAVFGIVIGAPLFLMSIVRLIGGNTRYSSFTETDISRIRYATEDIRKGQNK